MPIMRQIRQFITLLRHVPAFIWTIIVGIYDWILPKSWIAKDVSGDIVLITGAGSGLGRNIALEYARLGSSLVLWDISETGLQGTKQLVEQEHLTYTTKKEAKKGDSNKSEPLSKFCLNYIVDVSDKTKVKYYAEKVYKDLNKDKAPGQKEAYVSVLVNNAGIYHGLLLQDLKDEQIERIFNINVLSHFWTVRAFLPNMIKNSKGHIVEIASMAGMSGLFKQVDYSATKFATVGFEESLSIELDYLGLGDKIYTTAICPFFFQSNLFEGYDTKASSIMTSDYVARQTVWAMRCNYARQMLPPFKAYLLFMMRTIATRKSIILSGKALGLDDGIRNIKGTALDA